MSTGSSKYDIPTPTERDPLLGRDKGPSDEERASGQGQRHDGHDDDTPLPNEPTTGELMLIMIGPWIGSFLAAVDSTIVATLTAPISASFNSLSLLSWLASSYFIANAALQPLSGRLTDIISRKWGLVLSTILFASGNLICGLAQTEWVMIFGRVIAGCGGGCLNSISTFVGSDLIPLRRRGVWQGFGNINYGVGAAVGAVLGGWINDALGWRAAFLLLVPFTAVSGILSAWKVNVPVKFSEKSALKRIDFLGAFTLILSLVLLLLALNSGGNIVPWNHPLIYVSLPLSALFLVMFYYVERNHASEPMIPVKLLGDRTVIAACFTNMFSSMTIFAILYYVPIYFQVKGLSTTEAGVRLAPSSIGIAVGSVSSGLIMRKTGRYWYLSLAIMIQYVAANVLISSFTLTSPLWLTIISIFMAGLGHSGMLTVTLIAFISAVEHHHQAVVTSASYAFRSTGSAMGITIASAVFQNLLSRNLWAAIGDWKGGPEVIGRLKDNLDVIKELPSEWKSVVQPAYMESLRGVFLTTLGMCVLSTLFSVAMREHKLYTSLSRQ